MDVLDEIIAELDERFGITDQFLTEDEIPVEIEDYYQDFLEEMYW